MLNDEAHKEAISFKIKWKDFFFLGLERGFGWQYSNNDHEIF